MRIELGDFTFVHQYHKGTIVHSFAISIDQPDGKTEISSPEELLELASAFNLAACHLEMVKSEDASTR